MNVAVIPDYSSSNESPSMILCLRTSQYRFIYTFDSGYRLIGTVAGDHYANQTDIVFNLQALKAIVLSPEGSLMMGFDEVFGQFRMTNSEVILSGADMQTGSQFSLNYRDGEACIYDSITDTWITSTWQPERWQVENISIARQPKSQPARSPVMVSPWAKRAIA
ncbi:MAG: hypothetical protein ACFBSG_05650 [Leptolyngbyaceae cyanobacterium]